MRREKFLNRSQWVQTKIHSEVLFRFLLNDNSEDPGGKLLKTLVARLGHGPVSWGSGGHLRVGNSLGGS